MFDDTNTDMDITSYSEIKTAGKVNFNTQSADDYLTNENFKILRTNIFFCGSDVKSIVITSSNENEGKSTTSTELARCLAEAGKKTLLIDADMRKSVFLRKNVASRNFFGLSEYLSGQVEVNKILYNTQNPYFDVIFCGHFPPNPVELLGSERFGNLLSSMRNTYDYIIIDSPPLGTVVDAAVIAAVCDGSLIVITPGKVSIKDASKVKEQLIKSGCRILGVILNDVNAKNIRNYKKYYRRYEYSSKPKNKKK